MLQLVRPGEGTEDTRQPAELPEADAASLEVVRKLVKARLLVAARDKETGHSVAEVAHEALIREWQLLREWVDEDREFLRTRGRVQAAALLWEREGRQKDRLLPPGRPVAEAEDMLSSRRDHLPARLIEFIEASIGADCAAQDAARAAERRQLVRTRIAASVMALLLLAASALGYFAYERANERAAALAESQASQIWSSLDFTHKSSELQPHQVDALWELASGEPEVREAFLKQLAANRSFVLKLAERSKPILRALCLRLSGEQKQLVLNAVFDAMESTRAARLLLRLLAIVQELGVELTAEQAAGVLHQVLDVLVDDRSLDKDPIYESDKDPLVENVKTLGFRITPEEAEANAERLLHEVQDTRDADLLSLQVQALRALPVHLSAEQAEVAVGHVLDVMNDETRYSFGTNLVVLSVTLEVLPVALASEKTQPLTRRVLETIESTATKLNSLESMARASEAIATKLTTEPPRQQFRQQVQNALGDRFLNAVRATSDPKAIEEIGSSTFPSNPRMTSPDKMLAS